MRPSPVPFDPDLLGRVTTPAPAAGAPSTEQADPAPAPGPGRMLSEIISDMQGQDAEAADDAPAPEESRGVASPLGKRAKWQLSNLARSTYEHLRNAGEIPAGETEEAFRHRIALEACGRRISHARLGDRMKIQAAFLRLKGNVRAAAVATVKAANTARDIALHKLRQLLAEQGLSEDYAEGIARRVYKRSLRELSTSRQIWTVFYTVKNNANKKAGKGSDANRWKKLKAARQAGKKHRSL